MLESLDSIGWGSLNGCYRSASDMPEFLRSLLSPVTGIREWAIEEIGSTVIHQGTVYDVSPVVIPFLFELLENEEVQDKEDVVCLLTAMTGCCPYLETNVTSAEERNRIDAEFRKEGATYEEELHRERVLVQAVKSAIVKRFDLIYPYLRYPDDFFVRLSVAAALGQFPEIAARLRPDLELAPVRDGRACAERDQGGNSHRMRSAAEPVAAADRAAIAVFRDTTPSLAARLLSWLFDHRGRGMGAADWDRVKAAVPIGAEVTGRVVSCQPFGVFVDLGLGFPGLLEAPEFGGAAGRSLGMEDYPAVGSAVTAWVLQHADHNQQLRLTQRPLTAEQWEQIRGWVQG